MVLEHHRKSAFSGEHALHILAANRREVELVQAIRIAQQALSNAELASLCVTQASGSFFSGVPTRFYGSTLPCYRALLPPGPAVTRTAHTSPGGRVPPLTLVDCPHVPIPVW
jgi:hypothetical protein